MADDGRLLASLDLMRRMPPSRMENSLEGAPNQPASAQSFFLHVCALGPDAAKFPLCLAELVDLAPDLTDELLNTVDQPLQVAKDIQKNTYLLCDYNRDGDSYRLAQAG